MLKIIRWLDRSSIREYTLLRMVRNLVVTSVAFIMSPLAVKTRLVQIAFFLLLKHAVHILWRGSPFSIPGFTLKQ